MGQSDPSPETGAHGGQCQGPPLESADSLRKLATGMVIQAENAAIEVAFSEHRFAVGGGQVAPKL